MKFGYTIIYVPNVEETLNFYEAAFHIPTHFLHESKAYGELKTGDTKLAFANDDMAQANGLTIQKNTPDKTSPGFEIAFVTEDVEKAYNHACAKGATSIWRTNPKTLGPSGRLCTRLKRYYRGNCLSNFLRTPQKRKSMPEFRRQTFLKALQLSSLRLI